MNLREIREWVIQQTGRYNLVTSAGTNDFADNGVDKYILAGQRWLDRKFSFGGEEAEIQISAATGDFYFDVAGLRAVRDVLVQNPAEDTATFLARQTREQLYNRYGGTSISLANVDRGTPAYYVPGIERTQVA